MSERGDTEYGDTGYGDTGYGPDDDYGRPITRSAATGSRTRSGGTRGARSARPSRQPQRNKALIAGSVAVVVLAGAAFGVYASGILKGGSSASKTPAGSATPASNVPPGSATPAASAATPTATAPSIPWKTGAALISDGTDVVTIAGVPVTFPTKVSEAVFSGDGSEIAFVDGDGDVAVSRLDGTSRRKVSGTASGVTRSHPAWTGGDSVLYTVRTAAGAERIVQGSLPLPPGGAAVFPATDPETGTVSAWGAAGASDPTTSADGDTHVYQQPGKSGPEVWKQAFDGAKWLPAARVVAGSQPAVSPDGKTIAYVGPTGAIDIVATASGGVPKRIGPAVGATHLAWTPDSKSVAFSTAKGVEMVPVTGPASPTPVAAGPGTVTFLPARDDRIVSLTGSDIAAQAIAVSQSRWPTQASTPMPTGYGYIDDRHAFTVLLGAKEHPELTLAASYQLNGAPGESGPLLFSTGTTLDAATAAEIQRILGKANPAANGDVDTVTLLGGPDVLSPSLEGAVKALGYRTARVTAADRFAMAAALQPAGVGGPDPEVFVASADDPSGIAAAASSTKAVVITDGASMPAGMRTFADSPPSASGGDGGTVTLVPIDASAKAAIATTWPGKPGTFKVRDLSTKGAGEAAAGVFQTHVWYPPAVIVVPKGSLADSVLAAALARNLDLDVPVLVVDPAAGLDQDTASILTQNCAEVGTVYVLDGGHQIPQSVLARLGAVTSGPLGYDTATDPKAS